MDKLFKSKKGKTNVKVKYTIALVRLEKVPKDLGRFYLKWERGNKKENNGKTGLYEAEPTLQVGKEIVMKCTLAQTDGVFEQKHLVISVREVRLHPNLSSTCHFSSCQLLKGGLTKFVFLCFYPLFVVFPFVELHLTLGDSFKAPNILSIYSLSLAEALQEPFYVCFPRFFASDSIL
jgi:hypothetical protein